MSIITPVYNGMPYLEECIDSVLRQNFKDWEMLISDNCSTDETISFLETISDSRIILFKQKTNLGIFGNLNFLFQKARAEFSCILSADDYFLTDNALTIIINYWRKINLDVGFVRFNFHQKKEVKMIKKVRKQYPLIISSNEADIWFYMFGNIPGNISNISLRTNLVEKCNWFSCNFPYAGDFEFWQRAAQLVSFGLQTEKIVYIRLHENSSSNNLNKNGELISQTYYILSTIYQRLIFNYPEVSFALKLHGTFADIFQRDIAIKKLFKGETGYLKVLNKLKRQNFSLPLFYKWLIFLLTFGGRLGSYASAQFLFKSINKLKR